MKHCLFFLGKNQEISLSELKNLGIKDLKSFTKNLAYGVYSHKIDLKKFHNQLGGVIKTSQIIDTLINFEEAADRIINELSKNHKKGKLIYGINIHSRDDSKKNRKSLDILLADIKKGLRKHKISGRYLNKRGQNVNNIIAAESLNKKKAKIYDIIEVEEDGQKKFLLAISIAYQNVDKYALRDYNKPFRDAKAGMLPPKLAQTLINLATGFDEAEDRSNKTIYDPFCGSGTILMEGLIDGYNVIGSDISENMVEGSKQNIDFIIEKMNLTQDTNTIKKNIFLHNAIEKFPESLKCDAIATETYLGEAFGKAPTLDQIEEQNKKLKKLYIAFFKNIAEKLKKGTPVVVTFPFYKGKTRSISLSGIIPEIEKLGYMNIELSEEFATLRYIRPDQIVGREIYKFIKL
ncbi:DNA adenine methylase [Patescibacteria group bacterium]|nr:DNA adenine methylase [Patescibacteria group bacterium]